MGGIGNMVKKHVNRPLDDVRTFDQAMREKLAKFEAGTVPAPRDKLSAFIALDSDETKGRKFRAIQSAIDALHAADLAGDEAKRDAICAEFEQAGISCWRQNGRWLWEQVV